MATLRAIGGFVILFGLVFGVRAWRAGTWFDDAMLSVWIFDVGQGDAIFIDGPQTQILIDGGPDVTVLEKLGEVLPPWDRTIDVVIATHLHADHVSGLNAVLEHYEVGKVFANGVYAEPPAEALLATVNEQRLLSGQGIELGNGATLEVVWPQTAEQSDDPNADSVVTLLRYGEATVLLTGDAGVAEEEAFMRWLPTIDVLKVGHHGSDTSTSYDFLARIRPAAAVISVGEDNSYGHPSSLVVDRLLRQGTAVFRTDIHGDIRILTDGGEPKVAVFP